MKQEKLIEAPRPKLNLLRCFFIPSGSSFPILRQKLDCLKKFLSYF